MTQTTTASSAQANEDEQYEVFLADIQARFAAATTGMTRLFTTAASLWEAFLESLPADRRQHYTCRNCQRFVERFGGLVTIAPDGKVTSALWDPTTTPAFFLNAVAAMRRAVVSAKVDGVFSSDETTWGLPVNRAAKAPGEWHHMAVTPASALVHKELIRTASQVIAEKLQDHGMLLRGLAEFPLEIVKQAHTLLTTDALYRSEKCLGVAKWLLDLHEARAATKNAAARDNLTWLAVAMAPAGFAHVRSSMIGTLLEDLAAGLPFETVKRKFAEKMHPLQYQRPTALPSAGNIAQAEEIMAKLGAASSLKRRFAKLEDIQSLWTPKAAKVEPEKGGVFGHLKTKEERTSIPSVDVPVVTMTWEKFARIVLPEAERIELLVPHAARAYVALVTAADPSAPPILQWDRDDKRNPVSLYLYTNGSPPAAWNLKPGEHCDVTAIAREPSAWDPSTKFPHQGERAIFLLNGARDVRYERSGGLFPENLRSEYHAVRKTIEAYTLGAVIAGKDEATACGLLLDKGRQWTDVFRVTSKGGVRVSYKLDRWD